MKNKLLSVLYINQPIAIIVAKTRSACLRIREMVLVEYEDWEMVGAQKVCYLSELKALFRFATSITLDRNMLKGPTNSITFFTVTGSLDFVRLNYNPQKIYSIFSNIRF